MKIGGFNEDKGYSDDRLKTGVERARVEDAIFDHDIETSLKEMFVRNKWVGFSSFSSPKNKQFS